METLTKKGDADSPPNLEKTTMEATPLTFTLSPNTPTLLNVNREKLKQ